MPFYELTIQAAQDDVAALEDLLLTVGAVGVTYADGKDQPIYEPLPGEMPLWNHIKLTALFDELAKADFGFQKLSKAWPQLDVLQTQLKDQVWERVWMDHFKPMPFGQGSWVVPEGYDVVDPDAVNLILDPGLAFGTGTHATTALCLRWLDAHDVSGKRLVDFGCGSGILAVMALLHGAAEVICVDIDDQAIEATWQNARKNGVEAGIRVVDPEAIDSILDQDGVLANILAGPLMQLCDSFARMLKPGGFVVLSGLLKSQEQQVIDKYQTSFVDIASEIEQDWLRVEARKPSAQA